MPAADSIVRCARTALAVVLVSGACARVENRANDTTTATSSAAVQSTVVADTDDFGARLPVDGHAGARVVSLVPAATELIFAMGRGDRLVGRTTWDTYPDSAKLIPNLGDGIQPNVEVVLASRPTLVVLYAGNENRSAGAAFAKAGATVLAIKVDRISDFARLASQLGIALDARERAAQVVDSVQSTLAKVRNAVAGAPRPKVVWPLWDSPVLVVGTGSFLSELLDIAGADNIFSDFPKPSPEVTLEEIAKRDPAFVLSSPVGSKRLAVSEKWHAVRAIRENGLRIVDTTLTGRPAVTLGMAAVSLAKLLHPDRAAALP